MSKNKDIRSGQSGSIFTILMGGIAMVALVSLAAYQTISGPVASASHVTQLTMARSQLASIGSMTIMDAANQASSGDCDADGHIEPRPWRVTANDRPTNGGLIPLTMGAPTIDPWGMEYGYCAWDVGTVSADAACGGGTGMLDGADDTTTGASETLTVFTLISAGPNRQFEITCNNYVDSTTDLLTVSGGDDLVKRFTYSEAASATASLWKLKTGDAGTAALNKNLEIGNDINFNTGSGLIQALSINTTGKMIAGGGLGLSDETVVLDGDCTGGITTGLMRFHTGLNEAQMCLSNGTWGYISTAGVAFPILAPDGAAGAPNYSFVNYTSAGFYHEAAGLTLNTATTEMNFAPDSGTEFHVTSTGGFQMGDIFATCNSSNSGVMRYAESRRSISFCNGENWTDVSSAFGGTRIATGDDHTCGIKSDKSLWCWGDNTDGQLGDGTSGTDRLSPVEVSGSATWKSIYDGSPQYGEHSCAVRTDDTGWCWGDNQYGELGDGTTDNSLIPVEISGNATWKIVSAGTLHSCGLKTDDTAWCWGYNTGSLGDGTTNNSLTPIEVSGSATWKIIAAGNRSSCGIKSDGSAWCWGENSNGGGAQYGRLGNGSTSNRTSPREVSGSATWKTIDVGTVHTCGIKTNDTAWCWGANSNGQLGDGTSGTDRLSPVEVSGSATWKAISAGGTHSCGLKTDGTAWCWGRNNGGQVGDNTSGTDRLSPVEVSGSATWKSISAGRSHSCGVKTDNTAWCWGFNWSGKVGYGTSNQGYLVPVEVSGW